MKSVINLLLCIVLFLGVGCKAQKHKSGSTSGYNDFKIECMGTELDGSLTLKSWGKGRNYKDASEQAKKNAVRDVIFKGIHSGSSDCSERAILIEARAQEKYEDYFYKFFADRGEFTKYVSLKDEKLINKVSRDKKKATESVTRMVVVRVNRYELKQKLKQDNILK